MVLDLLTNVRIGKYVTAAVSQEAVRIQSIIDGLSSVLALQCGWERGSLKWINMYNIGRICPVDASKHSTLHCKRLSRYHLRERNRFKLVARLNLD